MSMRIAVLMPAYNADRTIREAVDSVLANTEPCDLFIIDDCSRVPVADVLGPREHVEIVRLDRNRGLAGALNIGLAHILERGYDYIARMDADDFSYPDRLAKQLAFMEAHPEIGALGTSVRFVNEETGTIRYHEAPLDHSAVRRRLFFNNAFVHSTWMLRAEVPKTCGFYSAEYPAAEDYEYLRRISSRVGLANLPDYLLDYRIVTTSVSVTKRRRQLYDRLRIQLAYFEWLEWRAWAGAATTLVLFAVPLKWLEVMKLEWLGAVPPPNSLPPADPGPAPDSTAWARRKRHLLSPRGGGTAPRA
jgi:glycosyltransferase involved in cell wall biosynthesis